MSEWLAIFPHQRNYEYHLLIGIPLLPGLLAWLISTHKLVHSFLREDPCIVYQHIYTNFGDVFYIDKVACCATIAKHHNRSAASLLAKIASPAYGEAGSCRSPYTLKNQSTMTYCKSRYAAAQCSLQHRNKETEVAMAEFHLLT